LGSKNKLKRFKENLTFFNLIQPQREDLLSLKFLNEFSWNDFFENKNKIVLELGCGKGEYTIELAKQNPSLNYVGIDIKGDRIWRGAKTSIESGLKNVAFVRTQIELIDFLFQKNSISEIWLTFPDPQMKFKRKHHRLTNPVFLKKYKEILIEGGNINLKTDSKFLHGYTLGVLDGFGLKPLISNHDIYNYINAPEEAISIQTFYEKKYKKLGREITYLKFNFINETKR